ncbi:MAG: biopolymer transporter ExbD [Candidatus Eremiobacteraeota bacterium]|nr:biopolymer transporter ExbD [Candidatus Eremiobacteraeota bacterium]
MSRQLFAKKRAKRKPRIEIIPMVDVMFLLLVFYILASIGLTIERGIPVSLPDAVSSENAVVEETKITITKSGDVFLNHDKVDLDSLGEAVKEKASAEPGGIEHLQQGYVVLNIDMDVPHRQVIKAMDQLREVGISNFSMATEEDG